MAVDFLTVINKEHKKNKIHSITCNSDTCLTVNEWCINNKVKIIIDSCLSHNNIMTTYVKYETKCKYWYMLFGIDNKKAYINLYEDKEKNMFRF